MLFFCSGQVAVITPRQVITGLGGKQVRAVAAAKHHTVIATEGGEVYTWGSNRGEAQDLIRTWTSFGWQKYDFLLDSSFWHVRLDEIQKLFGKAAFISKFGWQSFRVEPLDVRT